MAELFSTQIRCDLLKVGSCKHPACAALRGGSRRAIDFPALVGLLEHPQLGLVLYDTGYSRHFEAATKRFPECLYRTITPVTLPPAEELLTQLESRGIQASDIQYILISHFHADHVAGLRDFPMARYIATRKEYQQSKHWGRLTRLRHAFLRNLLPEDFEERLTYAETCAPVVLPAAWSPFVSAYDLLQDGSVLGIDLPGHVSSQLGLAFHEETDGPMFLVGDACWKVESLQQNRRPSKLAYQLFDSRENYDATFDHLIALHARPNAPSIIPSHCSTTWSQYRERQLVFRVQ